MKTFIAAGLVLLATTGAAKAEAQLVKTCQGIFSLKLPDKRGVTGIYGNGCTLFFNVRSDNAKRIARTCPDESRCEIQGIVTPLAQPSQPGDFVLVTVLSVQRAKVEPKQ